MATRKASDNRFPLVRLVTIDDTPATPPAGEVHLVAGVDMVLRYVDEDANVYELGLAGAGVPDGTDPGDLLAWDGAAWDVLPIGTDGDVLTADSGEALGLAYTTPSVGGGGSIDPGLESLWSTPTIVATEDDHFTGPSLAGKWLAYTGFDATTSFPLDSWVSLTSGAKLQAVPVGDWTIEAHMVHGNHLASGYTSAGLILTNGTTAGSSTDRRFGFGAENSTFNWRVHLDNFVNNVYSTTPFTLDRQDGAMHGRFLRITKSGTTYTFDQSDNRHKWTRAYSTSSLGITPTHFGVYGDTGGALCNYFTRT